MYYRLPAYIYLTLFTLLFYNNSFAVTNDDEQSPQAYLDYAISQQKVDLNIAKESLQKAYDLAKVGNNRYIIAKIILEQAQTEKLQKNYLDAQQYLVKAQAISDSINNVALTVDVLTNMSSVQRNLTHYEKSMEYVQKAITIARDSREPSLIIKSLQTKGTLLQVMGLYEDSITTYLLAQRYISGVSEESKINLFLDTANAYSKVNEYESSIRYYKKAIKLLEDTNDIDGLAKRLIDLANTHSKSGEYGKALESAKRSLAIARESNNEKYVLKALVTLSIVYRKISSYEEALKHGLEAIDIYQEINDFNGLAASSNSIGLVYIHLNQSENAKSYFTQVIELPINKIKTKYRASALRDLGKLASDEKNYQQAVELSNKAYALYEKIDDRKGEATVQKNLGYIYAKMGKEKDAINAYSISIEIFKKINDSWNKAESKAQLSLVLINIDIKESIRLAQDSLVLAKQLGAKSVAEQAYSALILAEEKGENYKQALAYAKKKETLINEIKTDAINKRSAEMYIILDVEKKERALEILKQEKAVISLELDNRDSKLRLLEKEKRIDDLQDQNTLIIVSVITITVLIVLLVLGRVYFNMRYSFIISMIIVVITLLYSLNSSAKDIIKLTAGQSPLDVRPQYSLLVLNEALELSREKYGDYEIKIINEFITNDVKRWAVYDGTNINLTMAMTSPDWEYLTIPIRIPIRRGVGSYRLLAINKNNQHRFTDINTIKQLKTLTIGLQQEWIMNDLFEEEGFNIVESTSYDGIFRMLNKNRFDFVPRGINEVYDEISIRADELTDIMIEPNIAIRIPQPYYIFVSPKYPEIAERIEYGLEKMISAGTLQKMFNEHYAEFIKRANLSNRIIINVGNKYLPNKTPIERKELWLQFDFEQN
ncbi:tetratricopeptide repeat protein [Colwellia echini]|uniref:Tetratricopeptide repeat protein n=1 Tax=Colwellia echini TaxID=1982103 RepID=A0ABY3MVB5_9GAMM|nr:tetratricopeptide repeat protein [Colwellia echini]TYK65153.1 tetratricopeptide repeat protein [Colwellia echini]